MKNFSKFELRDDFIYHIYIDHIYTIYIHHISEISTNIYVNVIFLSQDPVMARHLRFDDWIGSQM